MAAASPARTATVLPVQADASAPSGVDTSALALVRWGLLFAQPETETAYRAWHTRTTVPLFRAAGWSSGAAWLLALVPAGLTAQAGFGWAVAAVLVLLLMMVG